MAAPSGKVDPRLALRRRLARYLLRQLVRLNSYLELLDKEEEAIRSGAAETLAAQSYQEQSLVAEIAALQRSIEALRQLYLRAFSAVEVRADFSIRELEESLERLRHQVLERNKQNRQLLKTTMAELRQKIKELGGRPRSPASPFTNIGQPMLVDIRS